MPTLVVDANGDPRGVTSTSVVVEFEITPEQEVNGEVDK